VPEGLSTCALSRVDKGVQSPIERMGRTIETVPLLGNGASSILFSKKEEELFSKKEEESLLALVNCIQIL
jgi:hypothetical protein